MLGPTGDLGWPGTAWERFFCQPGLARNGTGTAWERLVARLAALTVRQQPASIPIQADAGLNANADRSRRQRTALSATRDRARARVWSTAWCSGRAVCRRASGGGLTATCTGAAPPPTRIEGWPRGVRRACSSRPRVEALETAHVFDHAGERLNSLGRQPYRAGGKLAHGRVAQRSSQLELSVELAGQVLVEEVLDRHAEEGAQAVQVLDRRVGADAGAQHLEVARGGLVTDELLDAGGDLAIGELAAVRGAERLEQMVETRLEAGHG